MEEMGSECGFGAFQWAKCKDLVPLPTPVVVNGEMRSNAQVLVDAKIGKWKQVWGDDPKCNLVLDRPFESLPRPDVADMRKAISMFPQIAAVGCDVWEPWTWKHLSDSALTDIGMSMEKLSLHPRQSNLNVFKLLPKPRVPHHWNSPNTAESLVQSQTWIHPKLAAEQCT